MTAKSAVSEFFEIVFRPHTHPLEIVSFRVGCVVVVRFGDDLGSHVGGQNEHAYRCSLLRVRIGVALNFMKVDLDLELQVLVFPETIVLFNIKNKFG